jgi:imidazole glycerol phosphate synthase subunit HisF
MTQRDLDLALRARQIADFPPEVKEAGAWPMIDYENPLAAMARAENTAKTMRYIEYATAVSNLTQTAAADTVDIDEALRAGAEEIGVKTSILRDPEAVAKIRAKRDQQQQELVDAEQLNNTADATLKLAKAGQAQAA